MTNASGILIQAYPYTFTTLFSVVSQVDSLFANAKITQFSLPNQVSLTVTNSSSGLPVAGINVNFIAIGLV